MPAALPVPFAMDRLVADLSDLGFWLLTAGFCILKGYQGVLSEVMLMYLLNERNQLG
jgi:hypothetical protein